MNSLLMEANYDALLYLVLAIMFGPAIILTIIGLLVRKTNKKAAKVLFIIAAVYCIISLGICGALAVGF
ncbi:hypothetical protein H7U19_15735 [Hyunsoonleella sp. SJ7]|uniref:Uncharacterized protein n=1 Tax=Hyunsoonleella aquatilis TaxID=2762758 RepID=A0A923KJ94_9FLAO|nr:hypothetical protein [Hyunsoonleella aquatilis]MBC3759864.1 hypothetical protein [Hyunsoonleella aquatilis]